MPTVQQLMLLIWTEFTLQFEKKLNEGMKWVGDLGELFVFVFLKKNYNGLELVRAPDTFLGGGGGNYSDDD